jgi:hypothetical protein
LDCGSLLPLFYGKIRACSFRPFVQSPRHHGFDVASSPAEAPPEIDEKMFAIKYEFSDKAR